MSNNNEADGSDYATEVAGYTDEELLIKERSKRRRKTGNVVGTLATAALATRSPGMWAAAGSSVKSLLNENSKHKIILQEIEKRGLTPMKSDMKDALFPVLTSAGGMFVGRAVGGPAGDSLGTYAGNLMHGIGNRAFGGSSKDKKDKSKPESRSAPSSPTMAVATIPAGGATTLQTPSVYNIGHNETPPATIVYHYVPPSAEYPRGYYAPAPVQPSAAPAPAPTPAPAYQAAPQPAPVQYQQPQVVYQQPQVAYQQPQITYQQPQITYQQSYQQPQTYQPQMYAPQQQIAYQYAAPFPYAQSQPTAMAPAPGGLTRAATVYDAPPAYQPQAQSPAPQEQPLPGLLRRARTMIERF